MTRRRERLVWPMLLSAACAVAGARLYDEWRAPSATDAGGASAVDSSVPPAADVDAALALPPLDQFAVIAERPLFAQSRRPPPPALAAQPAPPAETTPT